MDSAAHDDEDQDYDEDAASSEQYDACVTFYIFIGVALFLIGRMKLRAQSTIESCVDFQLIGPRYYNEAMVESCWSSSECLPRQALPMIVRCDVHTNNTMMTKC
jgi:hypothetical protein